MAILCLVLVSVPEVSPQHLDYTNSLFLDLDDVFVRKDLYEGKYKPDLEKLKDFQYEHENEYLVI